MSIKLNPYVIHTHKGKSIRHIYSEPNFRVISSYQGIFTDSAFDHFSETPLNDPLSTYSSGAMVKIDTSYYLCQDNLLTYQLKGRRLKTLIITEGLPRFRNLTSFNDSIYALFDRAISTLDLHSKTLAPFLIEEELSDFTKHHQDLIIAAKSGQLYRIDSNHQLSTHVKVNALIHSLFSTESSLLIGSSKGILKLQGDELTWLHTGIEVIDLIQVDGKIVFSNNGGLYALNEAEPIPIIENIEFNKMALHIDPHYIYAGSVNGLYSLETRNLDRFYESNLNSEIRSASLSPFIIFLILISLLIFSVLGSVYLRRQRKKDENEIPTKRIFNTEELTTILWENPNIVSAENLAAHLGTSLTQLNRHLKKEKTSSLKVLKKFKKDIAQKMHGEGKSLHEISKRTGYSIRYIKENFLSGS